MKDDNSTPTASGQDTSPNEFERAKPTTVRRDQAEAAIERLRKEGGVFVNAVRATRMAMAITDPTLPGNPIIFANDAFLKLSGYRMEEVLGQQPHFMNGPDTDPKDVARFTEALLTDQDDLVETIQYRKNGTRFVATVLLSAFKDDDGYTLNHFMSWLDVTRRVDAEKEVSELRRTKAALQVSEAKYRGLFSSIDQGFCVIEVLFDEAGNAKDYRFLEVNPAFERQTGLVDAEGKSMRSLAPDHEEHWFERYGRIATTGEPQRFEDVAEALGRWYDVYAFRVERPEDHRVAILFNDITQKRQAEQELHENQERQAFLLALDDRLRPLADGSEIMGAATGFLAMYLNVDRAMYAEVEGDRGAEVGTIRGQYVRTVGLDEAEVPAFPEHFTYETYGEKIMEARYGGDGLVVPDIAVEQGFSDAERSAWLDAHVAAAVVAPLVKGGRLVAELGVHSATPRAWTEAEVSLIRVVAERTWAAAERVRAETALRASEEKYRTLFESMDEAYAVVEVLKDEAGEWSDFRFLDANPAFIEHTSMPYPVGKTATELLGTPNPRWTELYGEAIDTGKPIRIEEDEPALGRTFDLNIFSLDRERNRVAVLFTDITDRKQTQAALRESERLRTAMLDVLPLAIALVDREGKVILSNREWERFVPTQVIPSRDPERGSRWRSWDKDGQPIDPANFPAARALRGERVDPPMEFLYDDDDGRQMWTSMAAIPVSGPEVEVVGAVEVIQDIDGAKRATEALRESEERFRLALTVGALATWDWDISTGKVAWNEEHFRIQGYEVGEVEPSYENWFARVHPDDRAGAESALTAARDEHLEFSHQFRNLLPDGRITWAAATGRFMYDAAGDPIRMIGVMQDVTADKEAQQALQDSERHAQVLLAELQHRVRNTLAVVRSIARRTAQSAPDSAEFLSHFEGRLNAFSRVQAVVTRSAGGSVELKSLVQDELLTLAAHQGEHLRIEGAQICLTPRAAESMSLAIHELATNAMKYGALSAPRGRINVSWHRVKDGGPDMLQFEWREHGLETPPTASREGFGHELLLRSLPYDLGAETKIVFEDDGLTFKMSLPLGPAVEVPERSNAAK